jgi:hypothetical protein
MFFKSHLSPTIEFNPHNVRAQRFYDHFHVIPVQHLKRALRSKDQRIRVLAFSHQALTASDRILGLQDPDFQVFLAAFRNQWVGNPLSNKSFLTPAVFDAFIRGSIEHHLRTASPTQHESVLKMGAELLQLFSIYKLANFVRRDIWDFAHARDPLFFFEFVLPKCGKFTSFSPEPDHQTLILSHFSDPSVANALLKRWHQFDLLKEHRLLSESLPSLSKTRTAL